MNFSGKYKDKIGKIKSNNSAWKRLGGTAVVAAVVGSVVTLGVSSLVVNPGLLTVGATKSSAIQGAGATTGGSTTTQATASQSSSASVTNLSESTGTNSSTTVADVFKVDEPAVVAVVNYQNSTTGTGSQLSAATSSSSLQEYSIGSGVLFKKSSRYGYIVTNNHVVAGAAKLEVVLYNSKRVTATVVGTDAYTDLAVLRVPLSQVAGINTIPFADSSKVQTGEQAIAIGTPDGLDFTETVTSGIISGTDRTMPVETADESGTILDYQSVIQTDAAINPGNSGGPLLNVKGQVIGINSSKIVEQGVEGMGFAIPSNEVKTVAQEILTTGHASHADLGISGYSLSTLPPNALQNVPVTSGVYVAAVQSTSAKRGGLKAGDVIVDVSGKSVQNIASLRTKLFALKPGDKVSVTVYRGSQKLELTVTLGQLS